MATPATNGRYVRLEFNVWYDASTRRVHITSNDPDLPPEGIHDNFRPGSAADRSARALLDRFGKLPPEAQPRTHHNSGA